MKHVLVLRVGGQAHLRCVLAASSVLLVVCYGLVSAHSSPSPPPGPNSPRAAPLPVASGHARKAQEETPLAFQGYKDCTPMQPQLASGGVSIHHVQLPIPMLMALPLDQESNGIVVPLIKTKGVFAPMETQLFYALLGAGAGPRPGGPRLVVDVGMNVGFFSSVALALGYDVLALEPQAATELKTLAGVATRLNRHLYPHARFAALPCAVGAAYGHVAVNASAARDTALRGVVAGGNIPQVALSDVVDEDVALLKVDTEGAERGVLAGAEALLARRRVEALLVEVKKPGDRVAIRERLSALGYDCHQYQEAFVALPVRASYADVPPGLLRPCSIRGAPPEDFLFTLRRGGPVPAAQKEAATGPGLSTPVIPRAAVK